jgi:uncharacterized protein
MPVRGELSNREARWLALEAQGLGRPRPAGRVDLRHLRGVVDRVGTIQLDAVNVLERTQFLVPFSRIGAYDRRRLLAMNGPGGDLFEYWGHAASLLPMATQPLFRWRMDGYRSGRRGNGAIDARRAAWRDAHRDYIDAVRAEVGERGPIPASALDDPRRRDGEWWERRSVGRQALEFLFASGEVAAWRSPTFERVYDLPERVILAEVLGTPTPSIEDAHRALLAWSVASHGVATVADLADYYRLRPADAAPRVAELVEAGELVEVAVEGWRQPGYCLPGARPRRPRRTGATLLSPFDSLIWERARTERLFGFEYRIEIYVPEPKRRYGYYVLPLLLGDELVARLDLKADRSTSTLRVPGAFLELGADMATVAEAAAVEMRALATWLGLEDVAVGGRGDLAPALGRIVAAAA